MIGVAGLALLAAQAGGILKAFPPATGHNGYEEYVQAADFLSKGGPSMLLGWQPGRPRPAKDPDDPTDEGPSKETLALFDRLNGMAPLDIRREALAKFGRSLDLVARGNAKPVFEPRTNMGPATLFPEYASFKNVTRLAVQASTVYAADGRTDLATKTLIDQLWFADNFGRSVLISHLVGIACTAISVVGFQDILQHLSEADAVVLERSIDSLLAREPAVRASLKAELAFSQSALEPLLSSKISGKDLAGLFGDDEEGGQNAAMAKEFGNMSPTARRKLVEGVRARQTAHAARMDRVFQRPEKEWIPGFRALEEEQDVQPTNLSDALISMVAPVYAQSIEAAVRNRTQMRLLKLYAQAVQYRWENFVWPERLDAIDPMNGLPYIYEVRADGTIRIASKGTKETGEIDLKYKRVAPEEGAKP